MREKRKRVSMKNCLFLLIYSMVCKNWGCDFVHDFLSIFTSSTWGNYYITISCLLIAILRCRGFTFYKMTNLDNRISNADQLLTQVRENRLYDFVIIAWFCIVALGRGQVLRHSDWTVFKCCKGTQPALCWENMFLVIDQWVWRRLKPAITNLGSIPVNHSITTHTHLTRFCRHVMVDPAVLPYSYVVFLLLSLSLSLSLSSLFWTLYCMFIGYQTVSVSRVLCQCWAILHKFDWSKLTKSD